MQDSVKINYYQGSLAEVLQVKAAISEFQRENTEQILRERLAGKTRLILLASHNKQPIAYKLGYQRDSHEFYSWLGGVVPAYRQQGIASCLLEQQQAWS